MSCYDGTCVSGFVFGLIPGFIDAPLQHDSGQEGAQELEHWFEH